MRPPGNSTQSSCLKREFERIEGVNSKSPAPLHPAPHSCPPLCLGAEPCSCSERGQRLRIRMKGQKEDGHGRHLTLLETTREKQDGVVAPKGLLKTTPTTRLHPSAHLGCSCVLSPNSTVGLAGRCALFSPHVGKLRPRWVSLTCSKSRDDVKM